VTSFKIIVIIRMMRCNKTYIILKNIYCVTLQSFSVRASRCIWANRRPGKVRKAPMRAQNSARISLKVSLDIGPLQMQRKSREVHHREAQTITYTV